MAHMTIQSLADLRNDFKARLNDDVKSLMRLYELHDGQVGQPGRWMAPLRKSSLVLIASNLESFLEGTVCGGLAYLCNRGVVARRYPEGFRIWRFRSQAHMRNLSVDNTKELVELSQKLYSEVRPLTLDELSIDSIKDQFANPIPKNVNWLMGLLDFAEYCNGRSVTVDGVNTNIAAALSELAQRRNDVAHGGNDAAPSSDDVKRLSKFAQMLSTRFMRDVSNVIKRCL